MMWDAILYGIGAAFFALAAVGGVLLLTYDHVTKPWREWFKRRKKNAVPPVRRPKP